MYEKFGKKVAEQYGIDEEGIKRFLAGEKLYCSECHSEIDWFTNLCPTCLQYDTAAYFDELEDDSEDVVVELPNGIFLSAHFGTDADIISKGCDSYIDYTLYDENQREIDGGQMEYADIDKRYENIRDAINDVLKFHYNTKRPMKWKDTHKTEAMFFE